MRFTDNGCQPCRDKRKKCDRARPKCRRCARLGTHCHGYREAFSIIHAENLYASRELKRPPGPRARVHSSPAVPPALPRDVQAEALAYYTYFHLFPPGCVPSIDEKSLGALILARLTEPLVATAVSATSLAIFSKLKRQPRIARDATIKYHGSLNTLRLALPDVNESSVDAYLLTIYMLARYEDSVYHPAPTIEQANINGPSSGVHLRGLTAGLRYWHHSFSQSHEATGVIRHSRRSIRKAALLGLFALPDWLGDGSLFGEHGADLALDSILVRLINVRGEIAQALGDRPLPPPEVRDILPALEFIHEECLLIDQELLNWISSRPESASHSRIAIADLQYWPEGSCFNPSVYTYPSPMDATIYAQICGYRILINHLRFRVADAIEEKGCWVSQGNDTQRCQLMTHLANDLASSIPFCLHEFAISNAPGLVQDPVTVSYGRERGPHGADLVAMPLVIASTSGYVPEAYRRWFASQLETVGRMTGFGLLEHVAGSPWFKL